MLPRDRIICQGLTHHDHERVAWEWLRKQLPGHGPYRAAAFFEFKERGGRLYEVDALVIGSHAVYLLEMKDWRGRIRARGADWLITQDGYTFTRTNPYSLTNHKAKVLKSLLTERGKLHGHQVPRVEALVFLTHPDVRAELDDWHMDHVVTRRTVMDAIRNGRFPGVHPRHTERKLQASSSGTIAKVLRDECGLVDSEGARRIGDLMLQEQIGEGPGYEDWRARDDFRQMNFRVRCYQHRPGASEEERRRLVAGAQREANLLTRLGDHRHILRTGYAVGEGPFGGPAVVFDWLEGGQPLWSYMEQEGESLALHQRVELIGQIAGALRFSHENDVVHRGLSPRTVWVSSDEAGEPKATLVDFQLARGREGTGTSGTIHLTRHSVEGDAVYRAPELVQDPAFRDPRVDMFSLGAVAWFILTGRPPAASHTALIMALKNSQLSLAAVDDALAPGLRFELGDDHQELLDDVMLEALRPHLDERADNPVEWAERLLEVLTAPLEQSAGSYVEPLHASKGEELEGGYEVRAVLGTGTTGRALRVQRGDDTLVMKIPIEPEYTARLAEEARQLDRVHGIEHAGCAHIVQGRGMPPMGGTEVLLLTDAGDTLADLLRKEGPPTLEYAQRWGQHLLLALEALEVAGVLHRDIKPANIGVGGRSEHRRVRLKLFDFSLAAVPRDRVGVGTEAYMDPWAPSRGRADAAVDRYAAAITLYELLTGVRPRRPVGAAQAVSDEPLHVDAERFDPAVRAGLARFFSQAFSPLASERHRTAGEMMREWVTAFSPAAQGAVGVVAAPAAAGAEARAGQLANAEPAAAADSVLTSTGPEERTLADGELAGLAADSPISTLHLSARSANALDRAGATTVADLLNLPRNRLSMIRGVGAQTSRELFELAERIRSVHPAWRDTAAEPWLGSYAGPDAPVDMVQGVNADVARRLTDAGLGRVHALVAAPKSQVEQLLGGDEGTERALLAFVDAAVDDNLASAAPATVEAWLRALLPPGKTGPQRKAAHRVQVFLGLAPERGGYATGGLTDAASRLKVTKGSLARTVRKYVERWSQHPQLDLLHAATREALDELAGVALLPELAEGLGARVGFAPSPRPNDPEVIAERARRSAALVRVVAETDSTLAGQRAGKRLWLGRSADALTLLDSLGQLADDLADREPLLARPAALAELRPIVADTPLARLDGDRLLGLAALASKGAALSARAELYPRALPATRAALLVGNALSRAVVKPEEIHQAVRARYPAASALPERPELDEVMSVLNLRWDARRSAYVRPELLSRSRSSTLRPLTRLQTLGTSTRIHRVLSTDDIAARNFDDRLRLALANHSALVVEIIADRAQDAAEALSARLSQLAGRAIAPLALDVDLLGHLRQTMASFSEPVQEQAVFATDASGPEDPYWQLLTGLMATAAEAQASAIHAAPAPRLLVRPGLWARYGLANLADRVLGGTRPSDAGATVLLLATGDRDAPGGQVQSGSPHIPDMDLPVPLNRRALLPLSWIKQHQPKPAAA